MYTIIEDAPVLSPNASHLNFTATDEVIPKGTLVSGKEQQITGKRRGQPFKYRLFITDDKKLIHLNKVKPMETEVTLGADAAVTPTVIDIIPKKIISKYTIAGAVIAGGGAFWYSKKHKYSTQKTVIVVGVSALLGLAAGRYLEKSGVFIKASK